MCLPQLHKKSTSYNHTSGCVTTPDLGDSLWQENNNLQFLKIDKLVYSHPVNCLISNRKLKVSGFPQASAPPPEVRLGSVNSKQLKEQINCTTLASDIEVVCQWQ